MTFDLKDYIIKNDKNTIKMKCNIGIGKIKENKLTSSDKQRNTISSTNISLKTTDQT